MSGPAVDRRVRIARLDDSRLWVEFEGGCVGCTGCSGACGLAAGRRVALPRSLLGFPASVGDHVVLRLASQRLHHAAALGYGLALVGLLGGAALGHALSLWVNPEQDPNVAVLIGAALGTLAAWFASKRPNVQIVRDGA